MKKILVSFLIIMAVYVLGFNNIANAGEEQGYITVSAVSEQELTPDVVDFSIEVITTSKESMEKAVTDNKKVSGKIYEDMKKMLDISNGDNIKTSNYDTRPVYRYTNNKRVLDYYQVTNNVKIHTKKVADIGKMIDKATSDGATSVNSVSYSVGKYENESNKLISETAKKVKSQADEIAKSLGVQITGIKSVDTSCSLSGRTNFPRMMLMSKSMGASNDAVTETSTNIEVGTMTLNARVNACFYVK